MIDWLIDWLINLPDDHFLISSLTLAVICSRFHILLQRRPWRMSWSDCGQNANCGQVTAAGQARAIACTWWQIGLRELQGRQRADRLIWLALTSESVSGLDCCCWCCCGDLWRAIDAAAKLPTVAAELDTLPLTGIATPTAQRSIFWNVANYHLRQLSVEYVGLKFSVIAATSEISILQLQAQNCDETAFQIVWDKPTLTLWIV